MRTALLLVVLAGLVGCQGGGLTRIAYRTDGTIPEDALTRGCAAWAVVDVECGPAASPGEANLLIMTINDPAADIGHEFDDESPRRIRLNFGRRDEQDADGWARTMAHEFGHALGIEGHFDDGPAVMNTWGDNYLVPILTDVDISGWHAMGR